MRLFNVAVTRIDVIVPLRDAAALLPGCLETIRAQTLPPGAIHLVVGPSRDATLEVARGAWARDPRVVVSENPSGDRGSAINVALDVLDPDTDAVAMVDAQSRLAPDYLERSADVLERTGAAVVGGPMRPVGNGTIGQAIAAALSSPVGVGDSSFHFAGRPRDVESVYLGVYRRSALDAAGRYDPTLLRTEDDDMNARIRAAGGRIHLDPAIRSTYLGRQTLGALFRQYLGYGHWKVALAAKRPDAIRLRHLVPAAFVLGLVVAGVISVMLWPPALPLAVVLYLVALAIIGLLTARAPLPSRFVFPLAVATMHLGYGIGSWQAILQGRWKA
jgi:cellulose synthase/poly-beta-1,6-N-acetylglucosamine synthase-like glycosyltransferase